MLRASALSATQSSTPMLQTAGNTVCSKRKRFNRRRSISRFCLHFERLPTPDSNAVTDCFYGTQMGLPLLLLFSSRSDRLAPYCFSTSLAGTHNYLAGIHNYCFTIRTMTTVHYSWSLGRWYCTIFFFFLAFANIAGPFLHGCAPPEPRLCQAWQPSR